MTPKEYPLWGEGEGRLVDFLQDCRAYCDTIERLDTLDERQWLQQLYTLLPRIFAFVSTLPYIESVAPVSWQEMPVISDQTVAYYEGRVADILGDEADLLVYPSDPADRSSELASHPLSSVLVAIYREVGTPLYLLKHEQYDLLSDSLEYCRMTFDQYWGDQLLIALRVLHKRHLALSPEEDDWLEL